MPNIHKKSIGIIFGPNGAGKGTISRFISNHFEYKHVNTGALLRLESLKIGGEYLKKFLDEGEMIDDEVVEDILVDYFKSYEISKSTKIVLEGIPRRKNQIKTIKRLCKEFNFEIKWVIVLQLPVEIIIDRVKDRVLAPDGHVYHLIYNPPPEYFKPEDFSKRLDDRPHIIEKRYKNYLVNTQKCIEDPIFSHVTRLEIDATKEIKEIYKLVESFLDTKK
jgi:adenylate kinase